MKAPEAGLARGRSPLRGRYLVQNRLWRSWLRLTDAALRLVASRREAGGSSHRPPRRLLLAVGGHLGDAVLSTSVLAPLQAAMPELEIGVLTGSWNLVVFENHPLVRWVHLADHWKLDRSNRSLARRIWHSRRSMATALAGVKATEYDAAVDLYAYYPNAARLLWRADIPVRVGYSSGGGGPLYTHPVDWKWHAGRHVTSDYFTALRVLFPGLDDSGIRRSELSPLPPAAREGAAKQLAALRTSNYVVFAPGAGRRQKLWPIDKWKELRDGAQRAGLDVVLTGTGDEERVLAGAIADSTPGVHDLTGRLSWNEFRAVVRGAAAVVSVDSVAAHVAAAEERPCLVLTSGMDEGGRWSPLATSSRVLTEPTRCAPCFLSEGCEAMTCVRGVATTTVLGELRAVTLR